VESDGKLLQARPHSDEGVMCILLGEVFLAGSLPLFIWFAVFVAVNLIYIPLVEESGLVKRFGEDYLAYKQNVPRWIPRVCPSKHQRSSPFR